MKCCKCVDSGVLMDLCQEFPRSPEELGHNVNHRGEKGSQSSSAQHPHTRRPASCGDFTSSRCSISITMIVTECKRLICYPRNE